MPECVQQECCPPDPYAYRSADAEDSQAGSRAQCPEIIVEISPVSGSYLFFPSYVILSADHEDAVIRYTLDGTDPTEASTLYSAPFQITQSGQLLKVRAFIEDCSPGPISTALYQNPPFPIGIGYGCTTPDNGGTWNAWAPNGTVDNHWQLVFTPATATEIQRFDVLQLDTSGAPSGIRWSTDSSPNPSLADLHNPFVWLKADAIPGLADGTAVASWSDSGGSSNNAVQATGSKQPVYKTSIFNSKPVVRFDGTDDELGLTAPTASAMTLVLVAKKRSAPSGVQRNVLTIGNDGLGQLGSNSAVHASSWTFFSGVHTIVGGTAENLTVITLRFDSLSSLTFYLDGVLAVTIDPADSFSTGAGVWLGAFNGANFGDYDIAELLIYDSALSDADRTDVEDYLTEKYFDPAPTFATWPLLVFVAGAQQWASYQNTLGIFAASAHTLDLYGDRQFPASGFFRMDMTLADGSVVSSIINATCDPTMPPVACPSPAAPTATPLCDGKVSFTFVGTAIGQVYKVYYSTGSDWTLALHAMLPAIPHTDIFTGLTPGVQYFFRVELEYTGCGFQSSIPVTATPLPEPAVTIATNKTLVDPNESFTISWTSNHIGGATCGGCLDGEVSINQGLGCKAGNTPGSQATSQATAGVYTYEITGCNTCGTITASAQVEVRDVAVCGSQPLLLHISNPQSFLCGFVHVPPPSCYDDCFFAGSPGPAWNGEFPKTTDCRWELCTTGAGCDFGTSGAQPETGFEHFWLPLCVWCYYSVNKWVLQFGGATGSANGCVWEGEKLFGNSPVGTYTQTAGCATGPATITIA